MEKTRLAAKVANDPIIATWWRWQEGEDLDGRGDEDLDFEYLIEVNGNAVWIPEEYVTIL